jgi:hypothetical protein
VQACCTVSYQTDADTAEVNGCKPFPVITAKARQLPAKLCFALNVPRIKARLDLAAFSSRKTDNN